MEFFLDIILPPFAAAAAGAFAGALGAQCISEEIQKEKSLRRELKITKSAKTISLEIYYTALGLMNKHVKKMKEQYDQEKKEADLHNEKIRSGDISNSTPFEPKYRFITLLELPFPINILNKQIFEDILIDEESIKLGIGLNRALQSLNSSISDRNDIVLELKHLQSIKDKSLPYLYLGLLKPDGITDIRYENYLDSIYRHLDDCIDLSKLLYKGLIAHVHKIELDLEIKESQINEPDFTKAEATILMPEDDYY